MADQLYPVSIKAVLFDKNAHVILCLNHRNEWQLPGGRIATGETPQACLKREVQEELALDVAVADFLDAYLYEVLPGRHVFIVTCLCQLKGSESMIVSSEHKDIKAFPLDSLPVNLAQGYRRPIVLGHPSL